MTKQYRSILKINMAEETSIEFRVRKIDETSDCLLEEIKHSDLISVKYKKTCKYLNSVENLLILASTVTGCVSNSTFASLAGVSVSITSSALRIKICAITAGIKNYQSIIRKNEKKLDKILVQGTDKLNTIEVLIAKALID